MQCGMADFGKDVKSLEQLGTRHISELTRT